MMHPFKSYRCDNADADADDDGHMLHAFHVMQQTVCKVLKIFQCGKYFLAYVLRWHFAGGPMMAQQHIMLAWSVCLFPGDKCQYC